MPIDLADTDPRIIVRDRTGAALPYSRGIMATSLLASGVLTEEAHRLAALVQARLLHHDRHDVDAHELVELARLTLHEHAQDPAVAERWIAWRDAKQSGRPIVIVLGGAPGVGKSTVATRLAVRLGITQVVTTDAIREVLRLVVPPVVLPELHRSTFDLVGTSFAGFERQCNSVASATAAVVDRLATEHRSVIVEGVHLIPGAITSLVATHPARPVVIERLITIAEAAQHGEHLTRRFSTGPLHNGTRHLDDFDAIRSIQQHLIRRADDAGIAMLDGRDTANLTQGIVDEIAASVAERAASRS